TRTPPGPQPELEASTGKKVERGRFSREHHRIAVVVVEHEASDAKGLRCARSRSEGRDRRELIGDVIRHEKGVVTESLGALRYLAPVLSASAPFGHGREAKGAHGRTLSHPGEPLGPLLLVRRDVLFVAQRKSDVVESSDQTGARELVQ